MQERDREQESLKACECDKEQASVRVPCACVWEWEREREDKNWWSIEAWLSWPCVEFFSFWFETEVSGLFIAKANTTPKRHKMLDPKSLWHISYIDSSLITLTTLSPWLVGRAWELLVVFDVLSYPKLCLGGLRAWCAPYWKLLPLSRTMDTVAKHIVLISNFADAMFWKIRMKFARLLAEYYIAFYLMWQSQTLLEFGFRY